MRLCLLCLAAMLGVLSPIGAPAQAVCTWLTQGTAEAQLGGPVTVSLQIASPASGACEFARRQGETAAVLQIAVATAEVAVCPAGSEYVPGIGNEAFHCRLGEPAGRDDRVREVISSRVRAVKFSVTLSVRGPAVPGLEAADRAKIVRQVAEEVAGNLF